MYCLLDIALKCVDVEQYNEKLCSEWPPEHEDTTDSTKRQKLTSVHYFEYKVNVVTAELVVSNKMIYKIKEIQKVELDKCLIYISRTVYILKQI